MILRFRSANYDSRTDFRCDIRLWISKNTSRHRNYLAFAAGQDDTRLMKGLLEVGIHVDAGGPFGRTALYEAPGNGRFIVPILASAGGLETSGWRSYRPDSSNCNPTLQSTSVAVPDYRDHWWWNGN